MSDPKILLIDIETAPNIAFVWGLFKENIPLARLKETSYVMCWAAKWLGQKEVYFNSILSSTKKEMLERIHALLSEADAVVHFNGKSFDIPILNKEFVLAGMRPPPPYKQIDLLQVARQTFRFTSNKLDHISKELGLGKKHDTTFELWVDCMDKKPEAWAVMEKYNKQDVLLLEKVYQKFQPWIKSHVNYSLYHGKVCCPNCGSTDNQRRGHAYLQAGIYQRFQCQGCGNWFRSGSTLAKSPKERSTNVNVT